MESNNKHYTLWVIAGIAVILLCYFVWMNSYYNSCKSNDNPTKSEYEINKENREAFVKKRMSDKYCRILIQNAVKERFGVEPEAVVIKWKEIKPYKSRIAGSFMTYWDYKKDKNAKSFYVELNVSGDSCEQVELVNAVVKSVIIDDNGYSSTPIIYELSDGVEKKITMKPGSVITIGGVKVKMTAQHYPVQEFETSKKLSKSQMQQVWEHEDRDSACNTLMFRISGQSRYDWYAKLEEKTLYIQAANADNDQWFEITKNGKNWSYKRVRY